MDHPGCWEGPLGMVLGGEYAVRMSFNFEEEPEKLVNGIADVREQIDIRLGKLRCNRSLRAIGSSVKAFVEGRK